MIMQWRMAIDPISRSQDWFVTNSNKYGEQRHIIKLIILVTSIGVLIQCGINYAFASNVAGIGLVNVTKHDEDLIVSGILILKFPKKPHVQSIIRMMMNLSIRWIS